MNNLGKQDTLFFKNIKLIQKKMLNNFIKKSFSTLKKPSLYNFPDQGQKYDDYRPKYPQSHISQVLRKVQVKNQYLDIATGTGQLLFEFEKHFQSSLGVENSFKMIDICNKKVERIPNVSVEQNDFMKWESKGRTYDLITIGEALHWFPIKDAFIKINGLLNERGIFGVYGYMIKDIREISGQKNEKFSRIYKNFEQNTLRKYAEVDVDELFNHYSDEVKYPFQSFFKVIQRQNNEVLLPLKKQKLIGFFKSRASYNSHILKDKDCHPLREMQEQINQEQVSCLYDYFVIICRKKDK